MMYGCCVMLVNKYARSIHPAQTESVAPCLPGVGVLLCCCVVVLLCCCVVVLVCCCVGVLVCGCCVLLVCTGHPPSPD